MTRHFLHSVSIDRGCVTDWDAHPFSVPAIQRLETLELHPKVTFFVGENGSGKSTLLEGIAEKLGFNIEGGTKHTNLEIGDLFDEPEAALSPQRQLSMLVRLHDLVDSFPAHHGLPRRLDLSVWPRRHPTHQLRGHRALIMMKRLLRREDEQDLGA